MNIDPQSHIPVYLQIVDELRCAVVRGVYREGEVLPSVRELSLKLKVNPNTVLRAYETLEADKVIEKRRGSGMYVAMGGLKAARERSTEALLESLDDVAVRAKAADMQPKGVMEHFAKAMFKAFTNKEHKS